MIPLLLFSLFILLLFSFAYWIGKSSGYRLKTFKTRVNEEYFSLELLDKALVLFREELSKFDPGIEKGLESLLNNLFIQWAPRRWVVVRKEKKIKVASEILSPSRIQLWIGPKVNQKPPRLSHTAFYGGLMQLVLLKIYKTPESNMDRSLASLVKRLNKKLSLIERE